MAKQLKGIAVSDGIAVAKAYLLVEPDLSFEKNQLKMSIKKLLVLLTH